MIIRFNDDKTLDFIDGVTELNENDLFYHNIKVELESSLSSTLDTLWIVFKNAIGEITKPVLLSFDKKYYTTSVPNEVMITPGECEIQILIRRTSTTNSSKYIIQRASFTYKITIQEGLTVEGEKITAYDLISLYETAKTAIDSIVNLNFENGEGINSIQQKGLANAIGKNSSAFGDSESHETYSFSQGLGTKATAQNQAVFGQYNEEDPEALLLVGNGEYNRSNAFAVKLDGRAQVQSSPKEEKDVVRKKELDEKIVFVDIENLIANNEYNKFLELSRQMSIGETIAVVKIDDKITTIQNVYYNDKTNTAIWSAIISSEMNIVTLVTIELINNVINWGVKDYNLSQLSSKITQLNSSKQDKLSFDGEYDKDSNKVATVATVTQTISDKLSEVVANAPESFDTLKEIADWIEEHPESVAELNSQIQANKQAIEELKESPATKAITITADSAFYDENLINDIFNNKYDYVLIHNGADCRYYSENSAGTTLYFHGRILDKTTSRIIFNNLNIVKTTRQITYTGQNVFFCLPKPSTDDAKKVVAVNSDGTGYELSESTGGESSGLIFVEINYATPYLTDIVKNPTKYCLYYKGSGQCFLFYEGDRVTTAEFRRIYYQQSSSNLYIYKLKVTKTKIESSTADVIRGLPTPSTENAGKVLGVNSIGNYAFLEAPTGGGVTEERVKELINETILEALEGEY